MTVCIVLAAGCGRRMGLEWNKVFAPIGDKTIIQWTLLQVAQARSVDSLIIAVAPGEEAFMRQQVEALGLTKAIQYVVGGKTRQESVAHAMVLVDPKTSIVLVHDGARPLASADVFDRVAQAAQQYGAAVVGVPVVDTIKRVTSDGQVQETLVRDELYAVQTPQAFQYDVFKRAQAYAEETYYLGTDDVSLVEHMHEPVHIVEGSYTNRKVTTPADWEWVRMKLLNGAEPSVNLVKEVNSSTQQEGLAGRQEQENVVNYQSDDCQRHGDSSKEEQKTFCIPRVGFGYDVHKLVKGRPCILCGQTFACELGPEGHSDADVPVHALMDALLGAAGLRDIGYYFPPEDDAFLNVSSLDLLGKVKTLLHKEGYTPYNIDVMIIAEIPKVKPYIEIMKENVAAVLDLPLTRVSIKATTNEGLDALGHKEGIAAQAVATIIEGK
ncbi:MAG: 2-C-methyl-D-erythritol 4-phosphate cytidylyltransferase [Veillonellaceae bacterium]|nr:2-C-methyl-D-erythritol 4-phosphate cytidylyltransferase [Veillonellaceae bacterium]